MPGLVVNPRARIFHGHDWVYASEIKKAFGNPQPGDVISLKDFRDRPLGSAIYNPQSQIVARRFSRRRQELDLDFFKRRLDRALSHRNTLRLSPHGFARIVWSESDGLPGVIIDQYDGTVVLQTNTLAMDQRRDLLTEAIKATLSPDSIVERNDSTIRKPEGLETRESLLHGASPNPLSVDLSGFAQTVDVLGGQKTGVYLDQWDNYRKVAALAKDRRTLDCFTNQGGFALACKAAGATEVTAIDSSEPTLEIARQNAAASNLEITWQNANVFDHLKQADTDQARYDLVILDPPSFTRRKGALKDALRGYKEIHLRALKILETGGILATFSCSHHVNHETFLGVIRDAAVDAKRQLRLVDTFSQRADHPVLATLPETEYLRGFAFETIGAW
ncbi:MAG: class I SAM-dependent rRNA methyltransferase [Verrucomicrobiota bacterium]